MVVDDRAGASGATRATYESVEELYQVIGPVMEAIAAAVGSHCEVVLHDVSLRNMEHTVYAIVNGHVSGREVGGPSTSLGLLALANEDADHDAYGYLGRTSDGRELSCSTVYYRNAVGSIIAALCINVDLTPLQSARATLQALFPLRAESDGSPQEIIGPRLETVLDDMITEALASAAKPVVDLRKPDRIAVMRYLEERGAFRVRRSMYRVAERLAVSRVTAYAYLDEIRRGNESNRSL